jgi:hypothetical protein
MNSLLQKEISSLLNRLLLMVCFPFFLLLNGLLLSDLLLKGLLLNG